VDGSLLGGGVLTKCHEILKVLSYCFCANAWKPKRGDPARSDEKESVAKIDLMTHRFGNDHLRSGVADVSGLAIETASLL
jgi:hypothetical protein